MSEAGAKDLREAMRGDRPVLKRAFETAKVLAWYGLGTLTFVLPAYLAWTQPRKKVFTADDGDNDVDDFCGKEESMAYLFIEFPDGNKRVTYLSMFTISHRCIWLTHLDMRNCAGVKADVKLLGSLVALRVLSCSGCGELHGEMWHLR